MPTSSGASMKPNIPPRKSTRKSATPVVYIQPCEIATVPLPTGSAFVMPSSLDLKPIDIRKPPSSVLVPPLRTSPRPPRSAATPVPLSQPRSHLTGRGQLQSRARPISSILSEPTIQANHKNSSTATASSTRNLLRASNSEKEQNTQIRSNTGKHPHAWVTSSPVATTASGPSDSRLSKRSRLMAAKQARRLLRLNSPSVRCTFEVFGRVQRVSFRAYTAHQARKLQVRGWCQNTAAGTVRGVLEGPAVQVTVMQNWLRMRGSPKSRVDRVAFGESSAIEKYSFPDFEIRDV